MNGNGVWKSATMFLAGLVLAMASFYVAEFRRTITREETVQLIDQLRPAPPWVQDRTYVMQHLDEDRRLIGELLRRDCQPVKR